MRFGISRCPRPFHTIALFVASVCTKQFRMFSFKHVYFSTVHRTHVDRVFIHWKVCRIARTTTTNINYHRTNRNDRISASGTKWSRLLNVGSSRCDLDARRSSFFAGGGNYRAKRTKLSHMVISQGCARPDARRNWLIYRCFRVAKTSKKAELNYAACTNCFIQMQFKGGASFADCKGEFKEAVALGILLTYCTSFYLSICSYISVLHFFNNHLRR